MKLKKIKKPERPAWTASLSGRTANIMLKLGATSLESAVVIFYKNKMRCGCGVKNYTLKVHNELRELASWYVPPE
jgi:hypothetical protein